mgnify:CR=1 FL=1
MDTDYGSTFVLESGKKGAPAIILLHGSVSNSFTWFSDAVVLSNDYNVFAVDIIGEPGFSDPVRPPYESGDYARWLKNLIENLGLKSATIIGLSLGGWMALEFGTTYPDMMDNLILMCPGGLAPENPSFLWKALFYMLFGKWGSKQIFKLINGGVLPDESVPGFKEVMEFTSLINKNFKPRMGKLPIFGRDRLSNLTIPVYLMFGENDYLLDPQKSIDHMKESVPHAKIELLKNTGHVIVNQTERILKFIEK